MAASPGVSFKSYSSATPATWAGTSPWKCPWRPALLPRASAGGSHLKMGTSIAPGWSTRSVPSEFSALTFMTLERAVVQRGAGGSLGGSNDLPKGTRLDLIRCLAFLSFSTPPISYAYKSKWHHRRPRSAQRGCCHMDRGTLSSVRLGYNSLKRRACKSALGPHAVGRKSSFPAFDEK